MATEPWTCPTCGTEWPHVGWKKWLYHPQYYPTHTVGCENCYYERIVRSELLATRQAALGLDKGVYAGMTLDAFEPETKAEEVAQKAAQAVAAKWRQGLLRSLVLYSPFVDPPRTVQIGDKTARVTGCGNGKTHLLIGLVRVALELNWPVRVIDEPTLIEEIKADYDAQPGDTPVNILDVLHHGKVLALDDVGTGFVKADIKRIFGNQSVGTNDWYIEKLTKLINDCYAEGRAVIITTNLPLEGLRHRIGPRAYSRLEEMGGMVGLDGYDRRTL